MMLPLLLLAAVAADPLAGSLTPGQRPMPYSFVVATGPQRGQPTCYICDTADKPAAVVFARKPTADLGALAAKLDAAAADGRVKEFRAWVTFLGDANTEDAVAAWARTHALRTVAAGTFSSPTGPPSYRIPHEAEAVVILFVKQKAVATHCLRAGELTAAKAKAIIDGVDGLTK